MEIRYYLSSSGKNPALEFINGLPEDLRAAIKADVAEVGEHPDEPAIVWRWITGSTPMREIKTRNYRTFFFIEAGFVWLLHCVKKQDQERGIATAGERMKALRVEIAEYVEKLKEQEAKKARKKGVK